MISRARYGIDYIKRNMEYYLHDDLLEKVSRTFDINYDMKDIQLSHNILIDLKDYYLMDKKDINNYIFSEQANNDGKLFIDCDQKTNQVKYCFTDSDLNILSANEYMNWNIGFRWDSKEFSSDPDWNKIAKLCKKNIKAINNDAKLMTNLELKQFINDDYTKQINEICVDKDIKI